MRWSIPDMLGVTPDGARLGIMANAGLPSGIQAYLLASLAALTAQYGGTTLDLSASGTIIDSADAQGSASISITSSERP